MHKITVRLKSERLIGTHHLPAGTEVTLGEKEAIALLRQDQAVQVAFDVAAVIPPPAKRPYLPVETATSKPGPKKAARVLDAGVEELAPR